MQLNMELQLTSGCLALCTNRPITVMMYLEHVQQSSERDPGKNISDIQVLLLTFFQPHS
jgi:hypothetical protein